MSLGAPSVHCVAVLAAVLLACAHVRSETAVGVGPVSCARPTAGRLPECSSSSSSSTLRLRGGVAEAAALELAETKLVYRPHAKCHEPGCYVCTGESDVSGWAVSVVGSWSKWLERHEATWDPKEGVFHVSVPVPVAQVRSHPARPPRSFFALPRFL